MPNEVKAGNERIMYRIPEAAQKMGVSRAYLYVLVKKGRIPCVRIGPNAVRIPCEALAEWVRENTMQEAA